MKLIDKLKNALFEDVEDEEEEEIAKQVDVEKTIDLDNASRVTKSRVRDKKYEEFDEKEIEEDSTFIKPFDFNDMEKKSPVIFDDEDFLSDTREIEFKEVPKKEEKILYRGTYEAKLEEKNKEKFKPSPVISPVYGVLNQNYTVALEEQKQEIKEFDHFRIERNKEDENKIDFDTVRQKAFGINSNDDSSVEDNGVLYEMKDEKSNPEISKITLGDAEEYFDDLGLEYNVDYKASEKGSIKNEHITAKVDDDTKEIIKDDTDDAEEKNLYDLIDLMYDGKEE